MTELEEKIYNGIKLTSKELEEAILECEEVTTEYGRNMRWSRPVSTIIRIKDKLFCIEWEEGLTECQDNYFEYQPYEVEEKERVIIIKNYIKKNK